MASSNNPRTSNNAINRANQRAAAGHAQTAAQAINIQGITVSIVPASCVPTPSGRVYTCVQVAHPYLCSKLHRGAGNPAHKSEWAITEPEEFQLFCDSHIGNHDLGPNYLLGFGNKDGTVVLGKNREVLARFIGAPQSQWHGHPAKAKDLRPDNDKVIALRDRAIISDIFAKRIMKRLV